MCWSTSSAGFRPALAWLAGRPAARCVCGFSIRELLQGCRSRVETRRVLRLAEQVSVIWPTETDCDRALLVFAEARLSHGLGLLDALIAQTVKAHGGVLFTFNHKHFVGVPDLAIVAPYDRAQS